MKYLLTLFLACGCSVDTTQLAQFYTGCANLTHVSGDKTFSPTWADQTFWIVDGCEMRWCCMHDEGNHTTRKECK